MRIANALTFVRLFGVPVLWTLALLGQGRLVGLGLILAGATDALDGYVARRLGQVTPVGAQLDSLADNLLLPSAAAWLWLLHPEMVTDNAGLLAVALGLYALSLGAGLVRFHRFANLHLYSAKAAGGCMYAFAVLTLVAGFYDRWLLLAAAGVFIVSSAETLALQLLTPAVDENMGSLFLVLKRRAETMTTQPRVRPRKQRSQAPTAKLVGNSAKPISNTVAAAAPNANESGP